MAENKGQVQPGSQPVVTTGVVSLDLGVVEGQARNVSGEGMINQFGFVPGDLDDPILTGDGMFDTAELSLNRIGDRPLTGFTSDDSLNAPVVFTTVDQADRVSDTSLGKLLGVDSEKLPTAVDSIIAFKNSGVPLVTRAYGGSITASEFFYRMRDEVDATKKIIAAFGDLDVTAALKGKIFANRVKPGDMLCAGETCHDAVYAQVASKGHGNGAALIVADFVYALMRHFNLVTDNTVANVTYTLPKVCPDMNTALLALEIEQVYAVVVQMRADLEKRIKEAFVDELKYVHIEIFFSAIQDVVRMLSADVAPIYEMKAVLTAAVQALAVQKRAALDKSFNLSSLGGDLNAFLSEPGLRDLGRLWQIDAHANDAMGTAEHFTPGVQAFVFSRGLGTFLTALRGSGLLSVETTFRSMHEHLQLMHVKDVNGDVVGFVMYEAVAQKDAKGGLYHVYKTRIGDAAYTLLRRHDDTTSRMLNDGVIDNDKFGLTTIAQGVYDMMSSVFGSMGITHKNWPSVTVPYGVILPAYTDFNVKDTGSTIEHMRELAHGGVGARIPVVYQDGLRIDGKSVSAVKAVVEEVSARAATHMVAQKYSDAALKLDVYKKHAQGVSADVSGMTKVIASSLVEDGRSVRSLLPALELIALAFASASYDVFDAELVRSCRLYRVDGVKRVPDFIRERCSVDGSVVHTTHADVVLLLATSRTAKKNLQIESMAVPPQLTESYIGNLDRQQFLGSARRGVSFTVGVALPLATGGEKAMQIRCRPHDMISAITTSESLWGANRAAVAYGMSVTDAIFANRVMKDMMLDVVESMFGAGQRQNTIGSMDAKEYRQLFRVTSAVPKEVRTLMSNGMLRSVMQIVQEKLNGDAVAREAARLARNNTLLLSVCDIHVMMMLMRMRAIGVGIFMQHMIDDVPSLTRELHTDGYVALGRTFNTTVVD